MSRDENPFAYGPERTEVGSGRTFHDYENPFAFQGPEPAGNGAGGGGTAGNSGGKTARFSMHPLRLQRWNTILRLLTFFFALFAFFMVFFSKTTANDNLQVTITYSYDGSYVFFLYTNLVVAIYALLLSLLACCVGRRGTGETTPAMFAWLVLFLNTLAVFFLLLAFAAALSIQALNGNGFTLYKSDDSEWITYPPLCNNFQKFCNLVDTALAGTMLAFLFLTASTCIDAYCIHRRNI